MILSVLAQLVRTVFSPFTQWLVGNIPADWLGSVPVFTIIAFGVIALAVGQRTNPLPVSAIGLLLTGLETVLIDNDVYGSSFGGLFARSHFADLFIWIILVVGFLVLLSSTTFYGDRATFHSLLLISIGGTMWTVMATDLVALFLAWELMSMPTYVLAALGPSRAAVDGAVKYFVMGLLATVLMLFGIALLYGLTGTTDIAAIGAALQSYFSSPTLELSAVATSLLAMVLFVIAFGFKIGAFPGWMWVPDTYSSADGSLAAFLAGGTKKAGVGALMRIMIVGFIVVRLQWMPLIVLVSILTMLIGNILALRQQNIMRMLAYSSIAMMGYLFIGLAVGTQFGAAAAMFHAFVHALMKTSAFILVWALTVRLRRQVTYDELVGLSSRAPFASGLLAVLMLSLAGMPPTAGLLSKIFLFGSAIEVGMWWLALIGTLNSVLSLGYYLRVLRVCYMAPPEDAERLRLARGPLVAATLGVIGVLVLFINPSIVLDYANIAASQLFG